MNGYTDFMLDCETMGLSADAVVCTVGIVCFDPRTGVVSDRLHLAFEWAPQVAKGRRLEPGTVAWWLQQSEAARQSLRKMQDEAVPPDFGVHLLHDWVEKHTRAGTEPRIWVNHAQADGTWVTELGRDFGVDFDYHVWHDYATVKSLCGGFVDKPTNTCEHDALADAVYQAEYLHRMWAFVEYAVERVAAKEKASGR